MTDDPWYHTEKALRERREAAEKANYYHIEEALRERREAAEKANYYQKMPKEDLIKIIESIKAELLTCEDAGDSITTIADMLNVDMRA
jgi:hypothetical protein